MGFFHGYGEAPKEEYSIEALRKAYDFGCTFFDTAEGYGTQQFYPGRNEEIVGKAVKDFRKDVVIATNAQISLAWMLHKYPNCVPIPGSKNQDRILENLGAWNVTLTVEEFSALEQALDAIPVHGHRGHVEYDGNSMWNWNKENK